jgi:DNA-directed RNA polymerase I subunit RPA2
MKTTTVRKLLPESWGFVCPVHTPDGAPCGLLNHLALNAAVVTRPPRCVEHLPRLLVSLGMTPLSGSGRTVPATSLPVLLDGRVVGSAPYPTALRIADALRALKVATSPTADAVTGHDVTRHMALVATSSDCPESLSDSPPSNWVPTSMEVSLLPPPSAGLEDEDGGDAVEERMCGPAPGLFLFTSPARIIRPIRQIDTGLVEIVSPMEQVCACPLSLSPSHLFSHSVTLSRLDAVTPVATRTPRPSVTCVLSLLPFHFPKRW